MFLFFSFLFLFLFSLVNVSVGWVGNPWGATSYLFFFSFSISLGMKRKHGRNSLVYACMLFDCMLSTTNSSNQMAGSIRRRVILSFERPIDTTNLMERDGISPTQKLEENG